MFAYWIDLGERDGDTAGSRGGAALHGVGFLINLCLGAVYAPTYFFLIPSIDHEPGRSFKSKVLGTDLLGAILVAGASVSGVIATSSGGVENTLKSGQIIASYITSGVLFTLFGLQQVFCILTNKFDCLFVVEFCQERLMILLFRNCGCFDRAPPSALSDDTEFPIYVRRHINDVCSSSPAFCLPPRLCMHS